VSWLRRRRSRRQAICLVSRSFTNETTSGVVRATAGLAEALAGGGHDVHVVTRTLDAPSIAGVSVHPIVAPPVLDPPAAAGRAVVDHLAHAAAVHRTAAALYVDVVVTPLWCCEGIVCALDERLPTVVTCMTSMRTILGLRPGGAGDQLERDLVALEQATVANARHLHGLTGEALAKTIAEYSGRPADTAVIPRCLPDRAGPAPATVAPERSTVDVLFVGRLELRKGVDVLIEAMRRALDAGTDLSLTLVGADSDDTASGEPYRAAFAREADARLTERVRFAGRVSEDDLDRLYRKADLVCVPSRYESHGIVAVEAMMYGKHALLAEPDDPASLADRLQTLAADPELRRSMGSRSRQRYEQRFSPPVVGEQMARFLAQVTRTDRPAPAGDLASRLAAVAADVLGLDSPDAGRLAAELLSPSAPAWRAAAEDAAREAGAWQARALEAERQRRSAEVEPRE
jgi:glycogen synthase